MTPDQALVFAAEIQAEAGHDRGKAIFAELAVNGEGNRKPRVAHEPFKSGIGRLKTGNRAGPNRKAQIVRGIKGHIAHRIKFAAERHC